MKQLTEAEYERMRAIVSAAEAWAESLSSKSHKMYGTMNDTIAADRPLVQLFRAVAAGKEGTVQR